jgi:hypothetical protein
MPALRVPRQNCDATDARNELAMAVVARERIEEACVPPIDPDLIHSGSNHRDRPDGRLHVERNAALDGIRAVAVVASLSRLRRRSGCGGTLPTAGTPTR